MWKFSIYFPTIFNCPIIFLWKSFNLSTVILFNLIFAVCFAFARKTQHIIFHFHIPWFPYSVCTYLHFIFFFLKKKKKTYCDWNDKRKQKNEANKRKKNERNWNKQKCNVRNIKWSWKSVWQAVANGEIKNKKKRNKYIYWNSYNYSYMPKLEATDLSIIVKCNAFIMWIRESRFFF